MARSDGRRWSMIESFITDSSCEFDIVDVNAAVAAAADSVSGDAVDDVRLLPFAAGDCFVISTVPGANVTVVLCEREPESNGSGLIAVTTGVVFAVLALTNAGVAGGTTAGAATFVAVVVVVDVDDEDVLVVDVAIAAARFGDAVSDGITSCLSIAAAPIEECTSTSSSSSESPVFVPKYVAPYVVIWLLRKVLSVFIFSLQIC